MADRQAAFDRELATYRARNIAAFLDGHEPVGPFNADPAALLLIDTRDLSSGETRSTLVFHFVDPSGIVAFDARRTSPKPTWHDDVLAHPHATVRRWERRELVRFAVLAHPVDACEADALLPWVTDAQPAWAEYQSGQDFPLVRLHRVDHRVDHCVGLADPVPSPGTPAPGPLLRRLFRR